MGHQFVCMSARLQTTTKTAARHNLRVPSNAGMQLIGAAVMRIAHPPLMAAAAQRARRVGVLRSGRAARRSAFRYTLCRRHTRRAAAQSAGAQWPLSIHMLIEWLSILLLMLFNRAEGGAAVC